MSPSPPFATRTHCSREPGPIVLREVDVVHPHSVGKPQGFWWEVDGDWRRWCQDEDWNRDQLAHLHAVDLVDANVLRITTVDQLDDFNGRFAGGRFEDIDWKQVGALYDGLEIAPYQWARRLTWAWYYGWDCASGVLWRPRNARVTYLGPIHLEATADVS